MFDREKVLSGLECCADPDTECGDCPYFNHTYFYPDCKETLIRSAVELLKADQTYLKAQEPVKPVPAIDDADDWWCGNCYQSVVGEEELDASGFVSVKFNFCPNCGKAVKWND